MKPALILHGGSWDWPDDQDAPKKNALREAARIGWDVLQAGGSALDAVEKTVNYLEDFPLFDAGTGSHLNSEGVVEMDALIIDGTARDYGAVAGVTRVQYPISLARKVLEETDHNLFVGPGADKLAASLGVLLVANAQLVTESELAVFQRAQAKLENADGHDTVGAIALDRHGNVAAATSTGGTPYKPAGRVGDSPLFGAGGYADSAIGGAGVSGKGEHSMRTLLSKYAVDQMGQGLGALQAAQAAIDYIDHIITPSMVGLIVLGADGRLGAAHSTPKMAIGWIDEDGEPRASVRGGLSEEV